MIFKGPALALQGRTLLELSLSLWCSWMLL